MFDPVECFTSRDGRTFQARPRVPIFANLPAGLYEINHTPMGLFYNTQDVPTSAIALLDDDQKKIIAEAATFWNAKEKYAEFGFVHKRGVLLYGPPGTGKTTTVRQLLADHVARDGVAIKIDRDALGAFQMFMHELRTAMPTRMIMLVIEDIDRWTEDWEERLLDILDGLQAVHGVLFLATTNHLRRLPGRLKKRPGRFDRVMPIGYPNAAIRRSFVESFAKGIGEAEMAQIVAETDGLSLAHIKEMVLRRKVYDGCDADALEIMQRQCDFPLDGFAHDEDEAEHDEKRAEEHRQKKVAGTMPGSALMAMVGK